MLLLLAGLAGCGGSAGVFEGFAGFEDVDDLGDVVQPESAPVVRAQPKVRIAVNDKATCVWVGDGNVNAERFLPSFGWVPSQQISDDTGLSSDPDVAMDHDGNAVVVWDQAGVIVSNRFDVGSGWDDPVVLSDPSDPPASTPQVAIDQDGDGVAVWEQDGDIVASTRDPLAGWSLPVVLNQTQLPAANAEIAISPAGDTIVVWDEGGTAVASSRLDAGTGQWAPAEILGAGTGPVIDMDASGNAAAAWTSGNEIQVAQFEPGTGWSGAQPVTLPGGVGGGIVHQPDIDLSPNGEARVAFCVDTEVFVSEIEPGTGPGPGVSVAPQVPACGPGLVAVGDDGNTLVVFQDEAFTIQAVPYSAARDEWDPARILGAGEEPSLDANSDAAVTVYLGENGIGGRVFDDLESMPSYSVDVTAVGGAGRVESTPTAIDCTQGQAVCSANFAEAVVVRLTATPAPGFRFSHWIGCGSLDPTKPECVVIMDRDHIVEAHFEPIP